MSEQPSERRWPVDKRVDVDLPLQDAIAIASDRIVEWEYEADPHGYSHDRPVLIALVDAADRWRQFEEFADGMLRG